MDIIISHLELGLVLTLCGLGAAFWLPAIIIGLISHGKKKNCTMNTVGLVIRINSKSSGDGSLSFYPVYEYYANGMKYTNEGASIKHCVPQVGAKVPVMYNPAKPKQSYIPGYDNKVYKILAIVFGIIGCIPILVCTGILFFTGI